MRFDAAKGDIVADAYRRTKGPVAYLDESYQTHNPDVNSAETFYVFTAVVVRQPDMAELQAGLQEIGGAYWHSTEALHNADGPDAMQDMLEFLADGTEPCVIAQRSRTGVIRHGPICGPRWKTPCSISWRTSAVFSSPSSTRAPSRCRSSPPVRNSVTGRARWCAGSLSWARNHAEAADRGPAALHRHGRESFVDPSALETRLRRGTQEQAGAVPRPGWYDSRRPGDGHPAENGS